MEQPKNTAREGVLDHLEEYLGAAEEIDIRSAVLCGQIGCGVMASFIETYAGEHPNMIKCFQSDLEACLAHLEFPAGHRRYIRMTNLIERAFVKQKRRTKVIPRPINEKGTMKLVYGSLI